MAVAAAVEAAKRVYPALGAKAGLIVDTAIAAYILARAKQAFTDKDVMAALTSERPWDMVRLVGKTSEEEAVIQAALPIIGDLVSEMDPKGDKPFFAYDRDDVLRLFEAVIYVWEENRGRVGSPDRITGLVVPPRDYTPPPPSRPRDPIMEQKRASQQVLDDEIPF